MREDNVKIILEGVDGSGKSTLAEKIKSLFPDKNFKIVHLTRSTPNNRQYFESLLFSKDNIIFDRFHIGQFIYQTEEQRRNNGWMTTSDLKSLEDTINHMKAIVKIIYVDTPDEVCLNNCLKDSEDSHYTLEYIQLLKRKYREFIENSDNNIWIYHNNFESLDPNKPLKFNFRSLPYTIAVDYDGVLAVDNYPDIGNVKMNIDLINDLIKQQKSGKRIVLWTCRTGIALDKAVESCKECGLIFDAVNDNIDELKNNGMNPRKIYCNEYIDDKATFMCFK